MKYFVALALLAAVAFLLYWRLRPYIRAARRVLGAVREVNRMREGAAPQSDVRGRAPRKADANEKLLRCANCGAWAPVSRAVSLRAGATYCSHACLERAADAPGRERKSAS